MWIPKLEDENGSSACQQIRVVVRDHFCKSSSVNKNNFLNYLRNFIESWSILSGRHEMIHWECIETEKVLIKRALLDLPRKAAYR